MVVECDHFSYWSEPAVQQRFDQIIGPEPGEVRARPPWWKQRDTVAW
jgi:hypothetical protein